MKVSFAVCRLPCSLSVGCRASLAWRNERDLFIAPSCLIPLILVCCARAVLSQVYPHGELRNPRYKPHGKPTDFLHGSLMPEQWQRIAPW